MDLRLEFVVISVYDRVMTEHDFTPFREKMSAEGVSVPAIASFEHNYKALCADKSGMMPEDELDPVRSLPTFDEVKESSPEADGDLLSQTVVIKLNGGLGTSMGLQKAKSLLKVKGEETFLDIIVRQIKYLRSSTGSCVRLLLMDSFSTSEDTLAYMARYADSGLAAAEDIEMMQNKIPKIAASDLSPVSWPKSPDLEWCPPGHGDLYPALSGSGWLDKLLAEGVKYAFVSNSDNLGAVLDRRLLSWFASSGAPFVMEVTRRTEMDKKGGHLALRKSDGQLVLREVAQCPDEDISDFQNIEKHKYFNTNSLWIRLDILADILKANGGIIPLPMIKNVKTVDPRDASSPEVYQLETAMGAGIECFSGAQALDVPRSRFAPVKTTADLFSLRSDAYVISPEGQVLLAPERKGIPPVVVLDSKLHKLVDSLDKLGEPSLLGVEKLTISGDVRFAPGVKVVGVQSWTNVNPDAPLIVD